MRKVDRRARYGSDGSKTVGSGRDAWPYLAIMGLVFLMGGSARHDIASLLVLRPLSVLICGLTLCLIWRRGPLRADAPLWFLTALIALVVLQLVPWPQALWQSLPGRDRVAEIQDLMGLGNKVWRPLSLAPARTYNALFSLAVPLAVLLSLRLLDREMLVGSSWRSVPALLIALGLLSILWGALQLLGPTGSPLYTYRITNADVPVGPFANRNHQAIFLASLVPLVAWYFLFRPQRAALSIKRLLFASLAMIIVLVTVLLTGSRAGSALALGAVVAVIAMLGAASLGGGSSGLASRSSDNAPVRFAVPLIAAVTVVTLAVAWLYTDAAFFGRVQDTDALTDLRIQTLPYIWRLVAEYFPVGSGFGSFEFVYKVIEPTDLLNRRYLNQAHNDVLQVVIEGGLAGLLILVSFVAWFAFCMIRLSAIGWSHRFGQRTPAPVSLGLAAALAALVLMLGSIFDYPLRTPLGMAYLATLCGLVASAFRERPQSGDHPGSQTSKH